jgi:hypothetical protein
MDWYFKAAIAVAVAWGIARSLGVYGEAARELDLSFVYGFLLTLGGWGAVFYVIDRVAKFLGWRRPPQPPEPPAGPAATPAADVPTRDSAPPSRQAAPRRRGRRP